MPILDADCIVAVDGKIAAWGREADLDCDGATTIIDARGCTLAPGLIDTSAIDLEGIYLKSWGVTR